MVFVTKLLISLNKKKILKNKANTLTTYNTDNIHLY